MPGRRRKSVEGERKRCDAAIERKTEMLMWWSGWYGRRVYTHSRTLEEAISWGRNTEERNRGAHRIFSPRCTYKRPFKEDPENVKDKGETSWIQMDRRIRWLVCFTNPRMSPSPIVLSRRPPRHSSASLLPASFRGLPCLRYSSPFRECRNNLVIAPGSTMW